MTTNLKPTSIKLPAEELAAIDLAAQAAGLSRSAWIIGAIRAALAGMTTEVTTTATTGMTTIAPDIAALLADHAARIEVLERNQQQRGMITEATTGMTTAATTAAPELATEYTLAERRMIELAELDSIPAGGKIPKTKAIAIAVTLAEEGLTHLRGGRIFQPAVTRFINDVLRKRDTPNG